MSQLKTPLKWIGGKYEYREQLLGQFPKKIRRYHEIFLGSGAMLIEFLQRVSFGQFALVKDCFVSDKNAALINFFSCLKESPEMLHFSMQHLFTLFNSRETVWFQGDPRCCTKEQTYYMIRDLFNGKPENKFLWASCFYYLNRSCFNGLWRENSKGGMSSPFADNARGDPMKIFNEETPTKQLEAMKRLADLLKPVTFRCEKWQDAMKRVRRHDFVFLDPPYYPAKKNSFVGYTADGFSLEEHEELFRAMHELTRNSIRALMTNTGVSKVRETFRDYTVIELDKKRKSRLGAFEELYICNRQLISGKRKATSIPTTPKRKKVKSSSK